MATKSAGRVSIRVLPDSTGFRRDLKTTLDRIERSVKAKIPVELVLQRDQLAEIKAKIESLKIKLRPDIELNVSPEQIAKLKAQIERLKPAVNVRLNTASAASQIEALTRTRHMIIDAHVNPDWLDRLQAMLDAQRMTIHANVNSVQARSQIAALTRPRRVSISPHLDNKAVANVLTKLAAMGGLNVLGDSFRAGSQFLTNIDRMMVKTAKLSLIIAGVASSLTTILGNIMVLGSDMLKIGNLAWLGPGFLTGTAIALTITGVALADMGERLKDLAPRMEALKKSIQDTFWAEADKPIRSLFENIYPRLFSTDGSKTTAGEMGKFVGEIAASIERNLPPGLLETMFDRMNDAIEISRAAINPLMHAFITLGEVGTRYFARFSTWVVKISEQFDDFVTKSEGNGDLVKWIDSGIQSLKDLGSLTRGTVRIFSSLTDAFRASGAKGIGDWARDFNAAADAMNRPEFQRPLVAFFKAMREGSDGLVLMFKNMGSGLASFVEGPLGKAMVSIRDVFAILGNYMGEVLANADFQEGFVKLFEGIRTGFANLEPAVKPFADSLGGIMRLMGLIAEAVGSLLATFMVYWGPIFDKVSARLETLIDPLNDALQKAIVDLTPLLDSLVMNLVNPLIDLVRDNLIPLFSALAEKLPTLTPLVESIGKVIREGLGPVIDSITAAIKRMKAKDLEDIFRKIGEIIEVTVLPLLNILKESFDGMDAKKIQGDLESVKTILDTIKGIIETITGLLDGLDWGKDAERTLSKEMVIDTKPRDPGWLKNFFDGLTGKDLSKELEKNINDGVEGGLEKSEGGFKNWFKNLFGGSEIERQLKEGMDYTPKIRGGGTKFSKVYVEELNFLQQLHKSWDEFWAGAGISWSDLANSVSVTWGDISTAISTKWNEIKTGFWNWVAEISFGWQGMWQDIGTNIAAWWDSLVLGFQTKMAEFGNNWDTFWGNVGLALSTAWESMLTWTEEKIAAIQLGIDTFISDVKTNWDTFWTDVAINTATKWQEIKDAIATKYNEIKTGITSFISEAKTNLSIGWESIKTTVSETWNSVARTISEKINEAVTFISELPGRAVDALTGKDNTLRGSGQSLIGGFISGMTDMIDRAQNTASAIMARVRAFFPFSPALEGPFSGRGYTTHSGAALVKDFAGGMMSNMDVARKAAEKLAEVANPSAKFDLDSDIGDQGITIDRRSVKVDIHNPVAEASSKTITTASNRLTMRKK